MPDNHAPQDTVNVPASDAPFRKIIDSTVMISVARFVMPALFTITIGGLGWVINDLRTGQRDGLAALQINQHDGLAELKDGQVKVWVQISKMVDEQSRTNAIQSGLSVQVANTSDQLHRLQAQVDSLPRR